MATGVDVLRCESCACDYVAMPDGRLEEFGRDEDDDTLAD